MSAARRHSSASWNLLAFLLLAGCGHEPQQISSGDMHAYQDARGMPGDVVEFIIQWQNCAHWLGEPAWNEARRREIEQAVREACPGVDERGRHIRGRYADNAEILERIRDYEPLGQ